MYTWPSHVYLATFAAFSHLHVNRERVNKHSQPVHGCSSTQVPSGKSLGSTGAANWTTDVRNNTQHDAIFTLQTQHWTSIDNISRHSGLYECCNLIRTPANSCQVSGKAYTATDIHSNLLRYEKL